jgi:hypothetical protein
MIGIGQWSSQSLLQNGLLVNIGSALLVILIAYGSKKRGQLLLLDHLVLVGVSVLCLIVNSVHRLPASQNTLSTFQGETLRFIIPMIAAVLLVLALTVLLHLAERTFLNKPLFDILSGLLGMGRRLLLLICAGFVMLTLLASTDNRDWDRGVAWLQSFFAGGPAHPLPSSPGELVLFLVLLLLMGITLLKLLIALFRPWEDTSDPNQVSARRRRSFIEFERSDFLLMLCIIIALLLLWNTSGEKDTAVSPLTLWPIFASGSPPLAMGILCLLVVAATSLLWLRRPLASPTHQRLRFLLVSALLCLLCSCIATLFSPFVSLFAPLLLVGVLLLIGGITLIALVKN